MAYFAQLDEDGIVLQVISIGNDIIGEPELTFPETDAVGRAFIMNTLKLPGWWRQTSYNGNFRGIFAGIGYRYDKNIDEFVEPSDTTE